MRTNSGNKHNAGDVDRAPERQSRQYACRCKSAVLRAGPNAGQECARFLQVVGGVFRVVHQRRIEEAEENNQRRVKHARKSAARDPGFAPIDCRKRWNGLGFDGLAKNCAIVAGNIRMLEAKIGGMTPDMLILNGRCVLCAANILRPAGAEHSSPRNAALRAFHVYDEVRSPRCRRASA